MNPIASATATPVEPDPLFAPLTIRHVRLRNRIVAPPMVQLRPIIEPAGVAWYRRLAAGGAGLVIIEATGVPRFTMDLTAEALRPLTDAIHAAGAAAAIQLFPVHFGQKAEPDGFTPAQLDEVIAQYGHAAEVCRHAGFNAVEPHGAHGYLINQFFMPDRNHHADEYGGTLENRCRLGVRIVEAIRAAVGGDLLILYRHTPVGTAYTIAESLELAGRLVAAGVDVLDISPAKQDIPADLAAPFKSRCGVPVIAVVGMEDPAAARAALRDGRCDLVAVGRQLIADARWPQKVHDHREAEILHCEKCNQGCFGHLRAGQPVACVEWTSDEVAANMA